jgi:protein involved in polysaccharide export with SLBB domain
MKNLFLLMLFTISSPVFSQELDEAYLNSLPEGVKNDVLATIDLKESSEKPVYRRASTMVDKQNIRSDLVNQKSNDKNQFIDQETDQIFGVSFFDTIQTSFMPVNEPNFDGTYILDYGDVIEIQLIGQLDNKFTIDIKRDGSINLPDIGNVVLSGLSLNEATQLIKGKYGNSFIGTEAFVTIKNLRDIQVIITGNAFNPGIYTLNGNANILFALSMAGGISKKGSYREIHLIRKNILIESFDLYDIFINGIYKFNNRLRSGDSILVKPRQNEVSVSSGVRRPGLYEMKKDESLENIIGYANGIVSNSNLDYIKLYRLTGSKISEINVNFDNLSKLENKNYDSLVIGEYKINTVKISGAVKSPGVYKIIRGETLANLINRIGGYEDFAYPFGGFLNNNKTKKINRDAKDRIYSQFIKNIIESPQITIESGSLPLILEELRNTKDVGRVIAEFNLNAISNNPLLDTILEDGDEIIIPIQTQQVYIYGEVNQSGAIRYAPDEDINYYIRNSGGATKNAANNNIYIVHPNGNTQVSKLSKSILLPLNTKNQQLIFPGSIIYVPRSSDITDRTQLAAIWAPIISSFALSAASVASISK